MTAPDPDACKDARPTEPVVSVVIPIYNESQVLPLLIPRLQAALTGAWEVCFVNDGSEDRSLELLTQEASKDSRFKVVDLSRNFGHAAAITAGLDHVRGDAIVIMDADLQDPPELIPRMVELYKQGFDVVHGRRTARRTESVVKRATAWLFYAAMRLAAERAPEANVGEFRLASREVVNALRRLREHHRLVRGLVAWVGFKQTVIDFERPARAAGVTKYPFAKMLRLAWDGMTSFSAAPLRLSTLLGFAGLAAGVGYAAYATYVGYILGLGVPGWTSLVILHIFFSGVVLLCLGLIGEYVARIFEEVKRRPLYLVRALINAEPASAAALDDPPGHGRMVP